MTHLFHNNKSAGEWLNDISTNTQGLAKSDNTNFNDGDKGSLNLAIKEENFYKIKQKISPTSPLGNDLFGGAGIGSGIAVYGNYAIVGANGSNNFKGAAYIFEYSTSTDTWTQIQKLEAIDGSSGDDFGNCVGIHGNYCIVGAPGNNDVGAVYLYEYSSSTSLFEFKSKLLTKEDVTVSSFAGTNFGASIDIYNDTIIVGANSFENIRSNNQIGGNWTYTHLTQTWTTTESHGLDLNDSYNRKIYFVSSGGGASPYEINKSYYVVNVIDENKLKLSETDGGSIVTSTEDGFNWKAAKMDQDRGAAFIWTLSNNVWTETQKLQPDFCNPNLSNGESFGF